MEYLAAKLKALRKEKGFTQEEVADFLQVSYQAISKWECGTNLPDIHLLPRISAFYNISIDELLKPDMPDSDLELNNILKTWECENAKGNNLENVRYIKSALKRYPENYILMSKLIISLEKCSGTPQEEARYRDEAIKISEQIIKHCPDIEIKNNVLHNICYSYYNNNQRDLAITCAKQLPPLIKAKENALVTFIDGDDKLQTAQNAIISLVRLIYHHLSSMLHCNKYTDMEQLDLLSRYILICDTLYENDDIQEIIHCKIEAYLKKFYILSGQNEIKQSLAALENVYTLLQKSFLIENSSIPVSPLGKYSEYKSTLNAEYKKRWVITSIETNYQKDMSQIASIECALNSNPSIHPEIMHLLDKIRSLE